MLNVAKHELKRHLCSVGTITKAYSAKVKKGRVSAEKPRPGSRHTRGYKVKLTVSKGPKPNS